MKKTLVFIALCLLSMGSLAYAQAVDLEINCRPIKESEYFRAFSLRLRNTDPGYKMVQDSVQASPPFAYIKSLELHPQIQVTFEKNPKGVEFIKKLTIFSGDDKSGQSAAFDIVTDSPLLFFGRLQMWWPGQTSSLREKVQCFLHDEWSNLRPVIP